MSALEDRLRAALKDAMRSRDAVARSAIRCALAAIDNAGSLGVNNSDLPGRSGLIAGGVQGLGAGDAPRREMDEGQIIEIVRAEVTSRKEAAEDYEGLGRIEEADRLHTECDVLLRLLSNGVAG
jgi:uncharacterized protein YqeY